MKLLAIACLMVAVAVGLWATKAVDDLQAELEQVKAELEQVKKELPRLKGGRKWTYFWLGNVLRHIDQCATHSDKRKADGPMCQWFTGFGSTPSWSDE